MGDWGWSRMWGAREKEGEGRRPHFHLEDSLEGAICWQGNTRGQMGRAAVVVARPLGDPSGGVRHVAEQTVWRSEKRKQLQGST